MARAVVGGVFKNKAFRAATNIIGFTDVLGVAITATTNTTSKVFVKMATTERTLATAAKLGKSAKGMNIAGGIATALEVGCRIAGHKPPGI